VHRACQRPPPPLFPIGHPAGSLLAIDPRLREAFKLSSIALHASCESLERFRTRGDRSRLIDEGKCGTVGIVASGCGRYRSRLTAFSKYAGESVDRTIQNRDGSSIFVDHSAEEVLGVSQTPRGFSDEELRSRTFRGNPPCVHVPLVTRRSAISRLSVFRDKGPSVKVRATSLLERNARDAQEETRVVRTN